jgi:hypothetical protein
VTSDDDPLDEPLPAKVRERCPPVCVQCDYSLIGLPAGSRCPECGAEIDESVISLQGWSPRSWATMRPREIALFSGAIVVMLFFSFAESGHVLESLPLLLAVVVFLGITGFSFVRYWLSSPDSSMPVRLRLSPKGFEQRIGPGPLKLMPWRREMLVMTRDRKRGRHSLHVKWTARRFLRRTEKYPIAFEFDADPVVARLLKVQIENWIFRGNSSD